MPAHSEQRLPQSDKWLGHQAPRPPPACYAGGADWRPLARPLGIGATLAAGAERLRALVPQSAQGRSFRSHTARRRGDHHALRSLPARTPAGPLATAGAPFPSPSGAAQRNSVRSMASAMAL